MIRKSLFVIPLLLFFSFISARPASAQWAVVDVGAIAQLIEQYETLQNQLTTLKDSLSQARDSYRSFNGDRGMGALLPSTQRNYLPSDYATLAQSLANASGTFGALGASVRSFLQANAVLSDADLARYAPEERAQLLALRNSSASLEALSGEALSTTSNRFAALQQLIDAIPGASDPKAVMDLQARALGELGMLANENTKLQTVFESLRAQETAQRQRRREQAIADTGSLRSLTPLVFRAAVTAP